MGKRYSEEIHQLTRTYEWACASDAKEAVHLAGAIWGRPLFVVGSGGSLTACELTARLHREACREPALALTPLEFLHHPPVPSACVLLISAAGRNPDILSAAEHAIEHEYTVVAAVVASRGSRLARRLRDVRHAVVLEFVAPSGKDGFLATNTLLATCLQLTRGYARTAHSAVGDQHACDSLPSTLPSLAGTEAELSGAVGATLDREHLIVLASGWATPAAFDLESKWSEAGFGALTVTDPRNFGHGRHHGLSRRAERSAVLALTTAEDEEYANRTLRLLPPEISHATVATPLRGAAGAIDLLVDAIRLAGAMGERTGFDPGRPRVPMFGRRLYHARIRPSEARPSGPELWLERKIPASVRTGADQELWSTWLAACATAVKNLGSVTLGGVVLDYDGTLCEAHERFTGPLRSFGCELTRLVHSGAVVGIATGRGKSVISALRAMLPKETWSGILVGLYNGGVIRRLTEDLPEEIDAHPYLTIVAERLRGSRVVMGVGDMEVRPTQITLQAKQCLPAGFLRKAVIDALMPARSESGRAEVPLLQQVLVFQSSHSLDILPATVSKAAVVDRMRAELRRTNRPDAILRIGDQGQLYGNDSLLLAHPLGVSADGVSTDLDGCWNLAPRGERRTTAVLRYLRALIPATDGGFRFSVELASGKEETDPLLLSPQQQERVPC